MTDNAILLAQGTGIAARAAGLAHNATAPEMQDALKGIELIARESVFWLQERPDADTRDTIREGLDTQAKRLDEFEDKLRTSADAKP